MLQADAENREIDRLVQRAEKRGAELREEGNLQAKMIVAWQREAACAARLARALSHPRGSAEWKKWKRASRDLIKAGDERTALIGVMTEAQIEEHIASITELEEIKARARLDEV